MIPKSIPSVIWVREELDRKSAIRRGYELLEKLPLSLLSRSEPDHLADEIGLVMSESRWQRRHAMHVQVRSAFQGDAIHRDSS